MKQVDSSKVVPFEDASLPNEPYIFPDKNNALIRISKLIPEKHTPHNSILLNDPSVYSNVGFAVRNADVIWTSYSDESVVIKVSRCNNFLQKIDHPAKATMENLALEIAVEYKKNGYNSVKTYYDVPGGMGL